MYHIKHIETGRILYNMYGEYAFLEIPKGLPVEFYTKHEAQEFIAHYPKIKEHVEIV